MSSPNAAAIASPRGLHPCLAAARRSLSLTGHVRALKDMCVPSEGSHRPTLLAACPSDSLCEPHRVLARRAQCTCLALASANSHSLSRALSRSLLGRERERARAASQSGVAERRRQYPMPSAEAARALRLPCLGLESVFPFMLAWVYLVWRHRHRCCRCSGAARRAVPLSGPLPPHSLARAAAPASPPRLFRSLRPSLLPNAQLPLTFCV